MRFIPVIFLLFFVLAYAGYHVLVNNMVEKSQAKCLASLTSPIHKDKAPEFCACSVDFIRDNPFRDKDDPQTKQAIGTHIRSCMDTHFMGKIIGECENMNAPLKKSGAGYSVDCPCFYEELATPLIDAWVTGAAKTEELGKTGQEKALNAMNKCLRGG